MSQSPWFSTEWALAALIERELEKRWLDADPDNELPGAVEVDLTSVPWEE